jgi:hypothetical protein
MQTAAFAFTLALATHSGSLSPTPPATSVQAKQDVEFEKRKTEAGDDVGKLWKLFQWCQDTKREKEGKAVLKRIVKLDPNHKDANIALGNVFYDGKWFANEKKVEEYKKAQELEQKRAQGLVEWKGQWVPADDVPYLEKGLVRDDSGNWVNAEEAKKLAEGWVRQDLDWIPPAQAENVAKNLWKCGDEWLPLDKADEYHAEVGTWWRIAGDRFHVFTTCERDHATQRMKRELDAAYADLERAYGARPSEPVIVIILRDSSQYGSFAAGDEYEQRPGTDALGLSSIHHAFFADAAADPVTGAFLGAGAGYWDGSSETGNKWGVHSVRHALGLSFGEGLDPSPKTIERSRKTRMTPDQFWESFYGEKRVPRWFRYGAAAYAERYYRDTTVGMGGDPLWARKWSVQNIVARGGLRQLKQVLEFDLSVEGGPDSEKLINEAGLFVAWLLDGGNEAAAAKLKAFQAALTAGRERGANPAAAKDREKALAQAIKDLEAVILENEAAIKSFAGI